MRNAGVNAGRRSAMKRGGGATLFATLVGRGLAQARRGARAGRAWNKAAFEAKTLDEAIKALGGGAPAQSKDIAFVSTPDIAENGAVVPIGVSSTIPKTESIAILVEKNPSPLVGDLRLSPRAPSRRSRRA